jgi:tetratricopeptide (TPR) repeat protein
VLLRLAYIKLVDTDLEGAEQLATRARDRLSGDPYRVLEAGVVLARAAIRRHEFSDAERMLVELGTQAEPATTPVAARAGAMMALAWAELALEQQDYATASERLRVVDEATRSEEALAEIAFTSRQMLALVDLALGRFQQACAALRDLVAIAKQHEANEDEIEARLGLAGALGEKGEPVNLEEAEKHLQIARDRALEAGLDSMHMAALVAQAGLLARKGQTRAAIDRCIEIAHVAAEKQDLARYAAAIALMAQIYEQKGDLASSYRTYAEAHASLREIIGDRAKDVIVPHMTAFADRIGRSRFAEIAAQVNKASHARSVFQRTSGKNHG